MEQTEDDRQTEDLEEGLEDVCGGEAAEEESKEGCETSVGDGSSNVSDRPTRSLLPGPLRPDEGVGNMDSVVHTQTDGEHDVDSREDVDGEAPEVHEPDNVHQSHDDYHEDN